MHMDVYVRVHMDVYVVASMILWGVYVILYSWPHDLYIDVFLETARFAINKSYPTLEYCGTYYE